MQLGIMVAARLALSRDKHVEVPARDCVLVSLRGSSGTSIRRLGNGYSHFQDTSSSATRCARLAQPNSGPVGTFRKRTSWPTTDMLPDALMLLDSRSLW